MRIYILLGYLKQHKFLEKNTSSFCINNIMFSFEALKTQKIHENLFSVIIIKRYHF